MKNTVNRFKKSGKLTCNIELNNRIAQTSRALKNFKKRYGILIIGIVMVVLTVVGKKLLLLQKMIWNSFGTEMRANRPLKKETVLKGGCTLLKALLTCLF